MRTIRALYRQFNYTGVSSGIAKMKKSLMHSLRLAANGIKPEWDDSLSSGNLLWYKGETLPLDDANLERREAIFRATMPPPKIQNRKEKMERRRKLRNRFKTYAKREREKGHLDAAELYDNLRQCEPQLSIDEHGYIYQFSCVEVINKKKETGFNQRVHHTTERTVSRATE